MADPSPESEVWLWDLLWAVGVTGIALAWNPEWHFYQLPYGSDSQETSLLILGRSYMPHIAQFAVPCLGLCGHSEFVNSIYGQKEMSSAHHSTFQGYILICELYKAESERVGGLCSSVQLPIVPIEQQPGWLAAHHLRPCCPKWPNGMINDFICWKIIRLKFIQSWVENLWSWPKQFWQDSKEKKGSFESLKKLVFFTSAA